jgi:polyhydroxyalkanoate synthesis regulator phasin
LRGVYLYKAYEEPNNLGEAVKSLVDEVVEKFGKLSLDELLNYVYSLDEVKRTGIGEVIL